MKDVILPKYFLGNAEDLDEVAGPRSFLAPDKSKFSLLEWINDGIEDGRINADITASIPDGNKGDITVFSNGNLWELNNLGVSPGTYLSANITVDAKGRVTAITNGSGSSATTVSVTPTGDLISSNVQAALEELQSDINSLSVTGNAIDISFTPTGNTTSSNVQAAIVEIQTDLDNITIPTTYTASNITVTPAGNLMSSTTQDALEELQGKINILTAGGSDGNGIYDGNGILPSNVTVDAATHNFVIDDLGQVNFILSDLSSLTFSNPGSLAVTLNGVAGFSFSDNRGIIYNGDYSNNYIARSLVDKGYVDGQISTLTIPTTASELPFVATGNTTSTNVQAALEELQTEIDNITIPSIPSTYAATAITVSPSGNLSSIDVQSALEELQGDIDGISTISTASELTFVATGNTTSTDVQAAIVELQSEIDSIPTSYAASAISVTPSGSLTSTTVQAALTELQGDINSIGSNPSYLRNVYETDESLTANRTVDADDNSLTISNLNSTGGFVVSTTGKSSQFSGINGWAYAADYSVDYTDRSLVDKRYVDNNRYTDSDVETYISDNVVYSNIHTLTSSAGTVTWTGQESNVYQIILTEDTTISNPSNAVTGATYTFLIDQDAVGSWALVFGDAWIFRNGTAHTGGDGANAKSFVLAFYDGTDLRVVAETRLS